MIWWGQSSGASSPNSWVLVLAPGGGGIPETSETMHRPRSTHRQAQSYIYLTEITLGNLQHAGLPYGPCLLAVVTVDDRSDT